MKKVTILGEGLYIFYKLLARIVSDILYGGKTDKALSLPISKMTEWGYDNYLYYNKGHMPPDFALEMTDKLVKLV